MESERKCPPKSRTLKQGIGFFGLQNSEEQVPNFPPIKVKRLTYDSFFHIPWPSAGTTHIERLIAYLTMGSLPITTQALMLTLDQINKEESGTKMSENKGIKYKFAFEIKKVICSVFPFIALPVFHTGMFNGYKVVERRVNVIDIPDRKGNRLAGAVAIAEAHNYLWEQYGIRLNQLIVGGSFARGEKIGKLNPYMLLNILSNLDGPGEYLVTDLLPKRSFSRQLTAAFLKTLTSNIVFKDGNPKLFETNPGSEGFLIISEKNIKEYQILKENGYFDSEPKARLLMTKSVIRNNGKPNFRSIALHSIVELQDRYPLGIPFAEIDRVSKRKIVELTGRDYFKEMFQVVNFESEKELINSKDGIVGRVIGDNFVLTKRIALIVEPSFREYPNTSDNSKDLTIPMLFRKQLIEYYLEHRDDLNGKVPVSTAKGIYTRIMDERGIHLSAKKITERTKGLCKSFEKTGAKYPSIVISEEQLIRVHKILRVLNDVPMRYEFLFKTFKGRNYIDKLFGHDINRKRDRKSPECMHKDRRTMIKKLLLEFLG
ncbi:MAG: hypothetical protein WCO33_01040 [bacterium]